MNIADLLKIIASTAWLILALYTFLSMRKWNHRFSELYEELKADLEEK